jgi:hypothetical protein
LRKHFAQAQQAASNIRAVSRNPFSSNAFTRMDHKLTAIERAFAMAGSGQAASVQDIKRALHKEGYAAAQIEGSHLTAQLRAIIKAARES